MMLSKPTDLVADTWTTLAGLSLARTNHSSAVINGKLYVFGGATTVVNGGRMDLVLRPTALRQTPGHARWI